LIHVGRRELALRGGKPNRLVIPENFFSTVH
jgi:hypothetical protein